MRFGFIKWYRLAQFGEHGRAFIFADWLKRRAVLHIQLSVQLNEPSRFFRKLGLLREGLFEFGSGHLDLTLQILKPPAGIFELPVHAGESVLNALDVASGVCAQLDVMLRRAAERKDVLAEVLKRDADVEAPEAANMDWLHVLYLGQEIQKRLARGDALGVVCSVQLYARKAVLRRGMRVARGNILLQRGNACLRIGNVPRETPREVVLQLVVLVLEAGLQQTQF